jgi:adenylylsulfate kinase-like enzyme
MYLYWLTGLAGAGKTTIGRELYSLIKTKKSNIVFLDGDILREVFGKNMDYSTDERIKIAFQYSRLCKLLTEQGIDVICATISMFKECRQWNRDNIPGYHEIYIRVPLDILIKRDQKQLYSRALKGVIQQVMGIDIPFDEPETPDMILDNDGSKSPNFLATYIFKQLV